VNRLELKMTKSPVNDAALDQIWRHGVWWEIGRRHDVPAELEHISSPALGEETTKILGALLPVYERIAGTLPEEPGE